MAGTMSLQLVLSHSCAAPLVSQPVALRIAQTAGFANNNRRSLEYSGDTMGKLPNTDDQRIQKWTANSRATAHLLGDHCWVWSSENTRIA